MFGGPQDVSALQESAASIAEKFAQ
jgi:hypothetical protein